MNIRDPWNRDRKDWWNSLPGLNHSAAVKEIEQARKRWQSTGDPRAKNKRWQDLMIAYDVEKQAHHELREWQLANGYFIDDSNYRVITKQDVDEAVRRDLARRDR